MSVADSGSGISPKQFEEIKSNDQNMEVIDEYNQMGSGLALC